MSEFRVAIVGAGPAGLTAAITARRCGLEVDVFEQAPRFARIGGAVGIQSNGLRVLDLLGLSREPISCCSTRR
jgi:2-polyprenyl-6-methoxyphenol hydroxylase-like FAD-dependent oxidoreductase